MQNASISVDMTHDKREEELQVGIKQHPCCVVAETDSVQFILDNVSNHTIINNTRHIQGVGINIVFRFSMLITVVRYKNKIKIEV